MKHHLLKRILILFTSAALLSANSSAEEYIPPYDRGSLLPAIEYFQQVADGTASLSDPEWMAPNGGTQDNFFIYGEEKEIFCGEQKKILSFSFELALDGLGNQFSSDDEVKKWEWDQLVFSFMTLDDKEYRVSFPLKNPNTGKNRTVYTVQELLAGSGVPDPSRIGLVEGWTYWPYIRLPDEQRYQIYDYTPGWNEIDGIRYYIKPDGTVLTKSTIIDGIRYKFDESGVCQGKYTGYTMSSKGKRYWKNGELVKNKWIRVKGERKYYAGADGYFVTGTQKIGGKAYSFDKNGALKKMPEKKEFPRIEVKFPDGAVYESSDGGANWTKDGEEAQRPLVYAAFKGECPLSWSGDACLTIYNGSSVPSLIENGVWFLREENGEWIEAEYLEEVEVLAASAYVIGENAEGRFKIPPELYVPFEGKCRYIHEMRDFDHQIYTVSAEFSIVGESTESVSP